MITVKLFGTLRLDSGVKELALEAGRVRDIYPQLLLEIQTRDPNNKLTLVQLKGSIVAVNGELSAPSAKLHEGDLVYLMPAVAGG